MAGWPVTDVCGKVVRGPRHCQEKLFVYALYWDVQTMGCEVPSTDSLRAKYRNLNQKRGSGKRCWQELSWTPVVFVGGIENC